MKFVKSKRTESKTNKCLKYYFFYNYIMFLKINYYLIKKEEYLHKKNKIFFFILKKFKISHIFFKK